MRTATLIIDMQVDFFAHERLTKNRRPLTEHTNTLIRMCRQHEVPLVWIKTEFAADLHDAFLEIRKAGHGPVIAGTDGARILPELEFHSSDIVLIKKRYSAFFQTDLEKTLSILRCERIVVAGINTHACVRTTVIDAYQRDYDTILAQDCIDSYDLEHHEVSWRYMNGKLAAGKSNAELSVLLRETEGAA